MPGGVECLGEIKRDKSDIRFRCQERGGLLENRSNGYGSEVSWRSGLGNLGNGDDD